MSLESVNPRPRFEATGCSLSLSDAASVFGANKYFQDTFRIVETSDSEVVDNYGTLTRNYMCNTGKTPFKVTDNTSARISFLVDVDSQTGTGEADP